MGTRPRDQPEGRCACTTAEPLRARAQPQSRPAPEEKRLRGGGPPSTSGSLPSARHYRESYAANADASKVRRGPLSPGIVSGSVTRHGQPLHTKISLSYHSLGMNMPARTITLVTRGHGYSTHPGPYLSMGGLWRVRFHVCAPRARTPAHPHRPHRPLAASPHREHSPMAQPSDALPKRSRGKAQRARAGVPERLRRSAPRQS
jgi:hypothetical protein